MFSSKAIGPLLVSESRKLFCRSSIISRPHPFFQLSGGAFLSSSLRASAFLEGHPPALLQSQRHGTTCVANLPPLVQAAHSGSIEGVRAVLRKSKSKVHLEGEWRQPELYASDGNGDSALLHAAGHGSVMLVRQELALGAGMEAAFSQASRNASEGGSYLRIARFLVDCGSDINHHGEFGATPLTWAALVGHVEMVTMLLDRGAAANEVDLSGDTALIKAVKWSFPAAFARFADVVRVLMENGADPGHKNQRGDTALSIATSRSHEEGYDAILQALDDVQSS